VPVAAGLHSEWELRKPRWRPHKHVIARFPSVPSETPDLGALCCGFSKYFFTGFYKSPAKYLIKNGFQPEAMEKPFCNLYYGGEAKNSGFSRLLPHM
jgi:hypothetical protein